MPACRHPSGAHYDALVLRPSQQAQQARGGLSLQRPQRPPASGCGCADALEDRDELGRGNQEQSEELSRAAEGVQPAAQAVVGGEPRDEDPNNHGEPEQGERDSSRGADAMTEAHGVKC